MPPTDDLCGPDKPDRLPVKKVGKRPFASSHTNESNDPVTIDDKDCVDPTTGNSAKPRPAATNGADNGEGKQTTSTRGTNEFASPKKVLPLPVAATSGADNNRKREMPLQGREQKKPKLALPHTTAATNGADNSEMEESPVDGVVNQTGFDYNSRKTLLLTVPGFQGLPERILNKILPRAGSVATNLLRQKQKVILVLDAGQENDTSLVKATRT